MTKLFSPLKIRGLELRNRIFVSPMCQYSAVDGVPQPWHLVHLGTRAVGGASLVFTEATAVSSEGRISPEDTGIWNEAQVEAFKPITRFIKEQGAVAGIQLAHAGRKASTEPPWRGGKTVKEDKKRWTPYAPSAIAFSEESQTPLQMQNEDLDKVIRDFASAAERSVRAGFEVIELHFAHGYLLHEFLSPFSNQRTDSFGGSLENRMRLPLMIVEKVRALLPEKIALFVRISATDWKEGGWDLPQSIELAKQLEKRGVDLIDCSSGGAIPGVKIPTGPGYQVPFAESIRKEAGLMTGAVGMITEAHQAEQILAEGKADAIFLARQLLRDPYWPLHAAKSLGVNIDWPVQYSLAKF